MLKVLFLKALRLSFMSKRRRSNPVFLSSAFESDIHPEEEQTLFVCGINSSKGAKQALAANFSICIHAEGDMGLPLTKNLQRHKHTTLYKVPDWD